MTEVWKHIEGFENYKISSLGRVISLSYNKTGKEKELKKVLNNHGYYRLALFKLGFGLKQVVIHRLVAQTFLCNPNNYESVNHINGVKTDNRVDNLEWCSHQHNISHAVEHRLHNYGEKHGASVLTETQVLEIKHKYAYKVNSQRGLAAEYGVSRGCITGIVKNKNWKHLLT